MKVKNVKLATEYKFKPGDIITDSCDGRVFMVVELAGNIASLVPRDKLTQSLVAVDLETGRVSLYADLNDLDGLELVNSITLES